MLILLRFGILILAFVVMGAVVPGVKVRGVGGAVMAAIVFTVFNFFFGWLLKFMLVVGTLGLAFLALNFIANAILLWLTDKALDDLEIHGLGPMLIGSGIITLANVVAHHFVW